MVDTLGNGRYRIASEGQQRLAYAIADRGRVWVFVAGRSYVIEEHARDVRAAGPRSDDGVLLSAPMPATVLTVGVAPGQQVREGDLLIMLEAMKMELPVKAPRDGTVKSIACREGEIVQPGVPLLELE